MIRIVKHIVSSRASSLSDFRQKQIIVIMRTIELLFKPAVLISCAIAGVQDIHLSSNSFSATSLNLNCFDSVVFTVSSPSTIIQVSSKSSCLPIDGPFQSAGLTANGSFICTFRDPGIYYVSSLEGCGSGAFTTLTVSPTPINPYLIQESNLLEQYTKDQAILLKQAQQKSAKSDAFKAISMILAVFCSVFLL